MNSADGKRFRKAYKESAKTGAVVDRKDFILLHQRLREALSDAQEFALGRIAERHIVDTKQFYNQKIKDATELGDVEEIRRLQSLADRL